ncbi:MULTISPECIES: hypothetical protein [unclassified Nocardioides]|uniref:hypothetical protein n=1 Tax=unclassified Nocardioides TaxID=2615069 RepID=UPI000AC3A8D9|nr:MULTISPECIES: hypothetical protein [unclassified Nocardioides]
MELSDVVPDQWRRDEADPVQVQRNAPYPGYDYWVVGVNVQELSFMDLKAYAMCVAK